MGLIKIKRVLARASFLLVVTVEVLSLGSHYCYYLAVATFLMSLRKGPSKETQRGVNTFTLFFFHCSTTFLTFCFVLR